MRRHAQSSLGAGGIGRFMIAVLAGLTLLQQQSAAEFTNLRSTSTPQPNGYIARSVTEDQLAGTLIYATDAAHKLQRLETSITNSRVNISRASASFGLLLESLPNDQSKAQDRLGQIILKASVQLLNRYCLGHSDHTKERCASEVKSVPLPESETRRKCEATEASNTYRRLLDANYADGLYHMGHSKPLPKTISDALYAASERDLNGHPEGEIVRSNQEGALDNIRNVGVVQWAQFIEHDLAKTVQQTMGNNVPIECCARDFRAAAPRYRHPACAQLIVESTAGKPHPISCLSYVRSALGVDTECRFGAAQQLNQATTKLDLSQLYGVNEDVTNGLRRFKNGELRATVHGRRNDDATKWTLPESRPNETLCLHDPSDADAACYKSGDSRVNIDPYVTTLYTLFLRQHNAIAQQIRHHRRSWRDERVFQVARRINTALYRRIVFTEWAPIIIGRRIDISDVDSKDMTKGISNEYATAAARFYFSMMPGDLQLSADTVAINIIEKDEDQPDILTLKNEFYKPRNLGESDNMERIMAAMLNQEAMAMDSGYVDDISKYRFRYTPDQEFGTDVLALDIQRGRDHGLAEYTKYVKLCSGVEITEWSDLEDRFMSTKNVNRLKSIYASVDQIDLIVGGISELPMDGATVGPTFSCIIDDTLLNAKRSTYLEDVWASTLPAFSGAQFVCGTTRLESVPDNIFQTPSVVLANSVVDCADLPPLDLRAFILSIA